MASFDSFGGEGGDLEHTRPFDSDGYMGYDPRLPSQRFDSFRAPEEVYGEEHYTQEERELEEEYPPRKEGTSSNGGFDDAPPPYRGPFDDDLGGGQSPSMSSNFGASFESRLDEPEFHPADDSMGANGQGFGHVEGFSHSEDFGQPEADSLYGYPPSDAGAYHNGGAVLPPPEEMLAEEGFMLREWKRKNALHLEEKARTEREKLSKIIDAADAFKEEFYQKRRTNCETNKKNNRDKEKVFLENLKDFHATADKHYWKAVAELVPHELPTLEQKSRGKKDDKKKPAVVINHGPKPGKAIDLTRMRQVLVKLKHNLPAHMKAPPPAAPSVPATGEGANGKATTAAAPAGSTAGPAPAPAAAAPLEKQGSIPAVAES